MKRSERKVLVERYEKTLELNEILNKPSLSEERKKEINFQIKCIQEGLFDNVFFNNVWRRDFINVFGWIGFILFLLVFTFFN